MGITQTKALMAQLKLTGMMQVLELTIAEAKRQQMTLEEMLDHLLQAEVDHQRRRRLERRIKESRLKRGASFEDFDWRTKRSITKGELREMMSLAWIQENRPLVLIGQTGVGKTYLAQACGLKACQEGKTVLFLSMTRWLDEHAQARETGTALKFRERMTRPDLLIVDDFGMRKLTAVEAEDLREILEERSYGKSTLVTTQLPFDHWSEVIGDPVLAEAIVDRLEQPAVVYKITGESYRKTKAQKLDSEVKKQ